MSHSPVHFLNCFFAAHFQNGELSDEFASGLDVCLGTDSQTDKAASVLVAVSKDNVYDGYVGKDFPTDLKRTFLAIRKKNSEEVSLVHRKRDCDFESMNNRF